MQRLPDVKGVAGKIAQPVIGLIKRTLPALITAVLITGVAVGAYSGYRWLLSSERFAANNVRVQGNERISAESVERSLNIAPGTNLFTIKLAALERRLETDPWIKSARVTRQLPDTLHVGLTEHRPVILVEMNGLYLADATGTLFKRAAIARGEGAGLPLLTGIQRSLYKRHPETTRAAIRNAVAVAKAYSAGGKRPRLGEIHLNSRRSFTIFTYERGLEIRVGRGDATKIAARLRFFDAAWNTLDSRERADARTVYVDNIARPDRVTIAFRN